MRIGIHTGPVVVGTIGNDLHMDYSAIGDTTNLAARLQSAARPGGILISDTTAKLVAGRFVTRPPQPLDLKGKSKPAQTFEVLRAREDRGGQVVFVVGEAGIGKSRLIHESFTSFGRGSAMRMSPGCRGVASPSVDR